MEKKPRVKFLAILQSAISIQPLRVVFSSRHIGKALRTRFNKRNRLGIILLLFVQQPGQLMKQCDTIHKITCQIAFFGQHLI